MAIKGVFFEILAEDLWKNSESCLHEITETLEEGKIIECQLRWKCLAFERSHEADFVKMCERGLC